VTEAPATVVSMTNHPGDRHVLAAAVQINAATIVTFNLRHFPTSALGPHRVAARSPDVFLMGLYAQDQAGMVRLLTEQGAELQQPRPLAAVLATLEQHAPTFVGHVRAGF
jgi:hypothetical protein